MKLSILANDGSPLGVTLKDVYGEGQRGIGIGGAELALLTMCEEWANAGHEVILFNNPLGKEFDGFEQRNIGDFVADDKVDVLIIFRSPNPKAVKSKALKVWWSCDQYTTGSFRDFAPLVDKIVTISPFHTKYFETTYRITNAIDIDLPVRVKDFDKVEVEKIPNRLIFTSVPDRGLQFLHPMWAEIKLNFPDASLVITSDYRLWGCKSPMNEKHRMSWLRSADVMFRGAIKRMEMVEEVLKAQLLVYPSIYEELFCIAVSEAQYAGAYPITSTTGALETTNMGTMIAGNADDALFRKRFMDELIFLLSNPGELENRQTYLKNLAWNRFHPDKILEQWNKKVFDYEDSMDK